MGAYLPLTSQLTVGFGVVPGLSKSKGGGLKRKVFILQGNFEFDCWITAQLQVAATRACWHRRRSSSPEIKHLAPKAAKENFEKMCRSKLISVCRVVTCFPFGEYFFNLNIPCMEHSCDRNETQCIPLTLCICSSTLYTHSVTLENPEGGKKLSIWLYIYWSYPWFKFCTDLESSSLQTIDTKTEKASVLCLAVLLLLYLKHLCETIFTYEVNIPENCYYPMWYSLPWSSLET